MAINEGGNPVSEIIKLIARVTINLMKGLVASFKKLSESIASAVGLSESVKTVLVAMYAVLIAMLLAGILTLRSCTGETDEVAATSTTAQLATTTEPPPTTTTTTTTLPEPTTTTSVPILNPVSQGGQAAKATTTTVKEPTRKTTPKTTVAPTTSTTVAPTTTAAPETTTTLPPTTTTSTIAGRVVTFDFQATMSSADKASTIPANGITALTSLDTTAWTAVLPNGTTSFSFKLFRFRNVGEIGVTYVPSSTNASCVDGGSQTELDHGILAGYYWVVTCTATGSGPISLPIIWQPPP